MSDHVVRRRHIDDLSDCVVALRQVHDRDRYPMCWPAEPAAWLTPGNLRGAWVASHQGRVAGHAALVGGVDDEQLVAAARRPAVQLAAVSRLFVRPAARRQRLGQLLVAACLAEAREHGLRVVLDVVDERGSAAIELYERLGAQLVGHRRADWVPTDGARPRLRLYLMPATVPAEPGL